MKPKVNLPKHLGSPNFQMWKRRKRMECEAVLKAMRKLEFGIAYTPAHVDIGHAYSFMSQAKAKMSNKLWKTL